MGLRTASVRRPHAEVMAPALTDTAQTQNFNLPPINGYGAKGPLDADDLSDIYPKELVSNVPDRNMSLGEGDDKMGLQKTTLSKTKTNNDMDQLFCTNMEANIDDIMQQVMKQIDGTDQLKNSSSDLNEILDLNLDKELLEHVDMMNIPMDDQQDDLETAQKIKENQAKAVLSDLQKRHARIERRLDFVRRRACKLQSRYMGQHVSAEITGVYEQVYRSVKKPKDSEQQINPIVPIEPQDNLKPLPASATKSLVRKLEMAAMLQANTVARQKNVPKYFGSGSIEINMFRSSTTNNANIPSWSNENKVELQKVSDQLRTQLRLVQKAVDSEATESSSGGESCDEIQTYSNPHQQYLSIQKRALWKYCTERAAIAARWTWLQSQISDLEYRIRQHTDLHKQIRSAKGPVQLGGDVPGENDACCVATSSGTINGYRGQLPGADKGPDASAECQQCARTRPLVNFRKRKLLQVAGLHAVSKKAARPSNVRCTCAPPFTICALCTGRTDPTYPRDPPDTLGRMEQVSMLDPGFHPVLSLLEDSSQTLHLEAIMKMYEWQQRSIRLKTVKALCKLDKSFDHRSKKLEHRRKYSKLKPSTVSALSEKIKNKIRGRKAGRPLAKKRPLEGKPNNHHHHHQALLSSASGLDISEDAEVEATIGGAALPPFEHQDSPGGSPLLHMQSISGYRQHRNSRVDSYDIDNIVIPYSVAASTRVEKLQYKEILTPKWRIASSVRADLKNNGAVPELGDDSDTEDVTEEAVQARHERCEHDEKKKFLSYLKLPFGSSGRQRSHKRTDSVAESSGGNTPDPMSPHPVPDFADPAPLGSSASGTLQSPPMGGAGLADEATSLPSAAALMRRRTISQSRGKDVREEGTVLVDVVEQPPYESRTFPLPEEEFETMVKEMPDSHHEPQTNTRAQDCTEVKPVESADSESTESAIGDDEDIEDEDEEDEDPNDPEWIDTEKVARERHRR